MAKRWPESAERTPSRLRTSTRASRNSRHKNRRMVAGSEGRPLSYACKQLRDNCTYPLAGNQICVKVEAHSVPPSGDRSIFGYCDTADIHPAGDNVDAAIGGAAQWAMESGRDISSSTHSRKMRR